MTVFALAAMFSVQNISASGKMLIAAGTPIGVKFRTDGVVITGIRPSDEGGSPALEAGLRRGDVITSVDGERINSSDRLCEMIAGSDGKPIELTLSRAGKSVGATLSARLDEDGIYRLGIWVRDSASGIGTVTFIDPETLSFAALGHGICDPESGALLPILSGSVEQVTLTGITQGKSGMPGEIHGFFSGSQAGVLSENSFSGVRGSLFALPENISGEIYPVGDKNDVTEGKAYVFTTIDGEDGRRKYEIEITRIDTGASQKNFTVKVTDPALIEKTGGIIQGMSGSPIIQNGKLIGAITHVMISDPSSGYGIFIANMLGNGVLSASYGIAA